MLVSLLFLIKLHLLLYSMLPCFAYLVFCDAFCYSVFYFVIFDVTLCCWHSSVGKPPFLSASTENYWGVLLPHKPWSSDLFHTSCKKRSPLSVYNLGNFPTTVGTKRWSALGAGSTNPQIPLLQVVCEITTHLFLKSTDQTRMVMMVMMIMLMISSRPDCRKGRLITNQTPLVAIDGQGGGGGAILMHHH